MKLFSLRTIAPLLFTLVLACMPLLVLAQAPGGPQLGGASEVQIGGGSGIQIGGGLGPQLGGGASDRYELKNPLKVTSFCALLKLVLDALMIIGLPVAVVFLIITGFRYILAMGNPGAIKNANQSLMYTVIGIAIFLGAWTIANIIKVTLQSLGVSGFGSC